MLVHIARAAPISCRWQTHLVVGDTTARCEAKNGQTPGQTPLLIEQGKECTPGPCLQCIAQPLADALNYILTTYSKLYI